MKIWVPPRARRRLEEITKQNARICQLWLILFCHEHLVVDPSDPRRAPLRGIGLHEGFHVRKVSADVPSFGALPRQAWTALGILELVCLVGLIVPGALHWCPKLTVVAAAILAIEGLVFVWVHIQYREIPPIIMSAVLGLLMAFIAYGRMVLKPF